jgi:tungstate transport system substrate-binding protein
VHDAFISEIERLKMKTTTIALIALVTIIVASVGGYTYLNMPKQEKAQPSPTIYYVAIESSMNGTTTPASGTYNYTEGSSVTFTAMPNSGYRFDYWRFDYWLIGGINDTTNPVTKTITSNFTINPVFSPEPLTLTVSSTTSLYETGVENDALKPAFQAKYPWITLNFLSQGTGAAIQTAMRGDADMIMVHDPKQEKTFMENGYGVNRKIIAYNFFIIVGPQNDPANITGLAPLDAVKKIYQLGQSGQAIWVSRGDGSGTHSKEKSLWAAAGISWSQIRTQTSWYKETGQGMTATLVIANYFGGYTLSDTASYLTNTKAKNINMKIVVEAHKDLLNVYSCIIDDPRNANLTTTHFDASMLFVQFMVSDEGQQLLADYGTATFGQTLFSPFVPLASNPTLNATLLGWIQNYAYIPPNATECPAAYRYNAGSLYSPSYDALAIINPGGKIQMVANYGESIFAKSSLNTYAVMVIAESNEKAAGKNRL